VRPRPASIIPSRQLFPDRSYRYINLKAILEIQDRGAFPVLQAFQFFNTLRSQLGPIPLDILTPPLKRGGVNRSWFLTDIIVELVFADLIVFQFSSDPLKDGQILRLLASRRARWFNVFNRYRDRYLFPICFPKLPSTLHGGLPPFHPPIPVEIRFAAIWMKDHRRSVNGREVCFAIVRVEFVPTMLDSSTKFIVGLVILKL
jgi:hypothetical protein